MTYDVFVRNDWSAGARLQSPLYVKGLKFYSEVNDSNKNCSVGTQAKSQVKQLIGSSERFLFEILSVLQLKLPVFNSEIKVMLWHTF